MWSWGEGSALIRLGPALRFNSAIKIRIQKKLLWSAVAAAALVAGVLAAAPPVAPGRKALDLLLSARYEEFTQLLTDDAKALLTTQFLRERVGSEIKAFGTLQEVGEPETSKSGVYNLVTFPVRFSKAAIKIQLTLDEAGRVAGLHLANASEAQSAVWARARYSNPALFREREVTVGQDRWKLGGTLTVPAANGRFPAIVLVHGAGPDDRNESIFANRMFEDMAEGLSSNNIVVLRYEKRTRTYAAEMSNTDYTLWDETIEDATRAVALLGQQPEVDITRVYVVGHSLGGYAIPRIVSKCEQQGLHIAGAVFLAANARHIEDLALQQAEFLTRDGGPPDKLRQLEELRRQVELIRHLDAKLQYPSTLIGLPVVYFFDLQGYDPVAAAARLRIPMLFLQGERDFQVTMEDFGLWKIGLADSRQATFRTYAALNHLFIPGDGPPSAAEYRNPGNVSPAVIEDIARWLSAPKH